MQSTLRSCPALQDTCIRTEQNELRVLMADISQSASLGEINTTGECARPATVVVLHVHHIHTASPQSVEV